MSILFSELSCRQLRIAQVSPYDFAHPGGLQRHIASLSRELQARGHELSILSPCTSEEAALYTGDVDFHAFGRSVPIPTAGSIATISFSVWPESVSSSRIRATDTSGARGGRCMLSVNL